jgi:hypothetical protein
MQDMMEGIIDRLKVMNSMAFNGFMPDSDEEGNLIQSEKPAGGYRKEFKKSVEEGEILRYTIAHQISTHKEIDDFINKQRQAEADRLNEEYYKKQKDLKIKQCMD